MEKERPSKMSDTRENICPRQQTVQNEKLPRSNLSHKPKNDLGDDSGC